MAIYNASANAVAERFAYTAYGVVLALNPTDFSFPYTGTDYDWTILYTGRAGRRERAVLLPHAGLSSGAWGVCEQGSDAGGPEPLRLLRKKSRQLRGPYRITGQTRNCRLRREPTGVVTIAGRGSFGILTLNDQYSQGDWYSRLGSDFYALRTGSRAHFVNATGKCCCCEVGFIQVVASDASYNGRLPSAPKNWRFDRSDWLPASSIKTKPRRVM